jgi:hypothetical protein
MRGVQVGSKTGRFQLYSVVCRALVRMQFLFPATSLSVPAHLSPACLGECFRPVVIQCSACSLGEFVKMDRIEFC